MTREVVIPTTGEVVDSSSEAWRAYCEARHLAHMPKAKRDAWLAEIAKARGEACARKLYEQAAEIYRHENRRPG